MKSSRIERALILAIFSLALIASFCVIAGSDDCSAIDVPDYFEQDGLSYSKDSMGTGYEIVGVDQTAISEELTIRNVIYQGVQEVSVTGVAAEAFKDVTKLEVLTFSGSDLTAIYERAFKGCTNLEIINFDASELTRIYESAFEGCTSLKMTYFSPDNKIDDIGSYAFKGCTSLMSFTLADPTTGVDYNIVGFGDRVFEGCTSITHVTLKQVYSFGEFPFTGCTSLEGMKVEGEGVEPMEYGPIYSNSTQSKLLHFPIAMNTTQYTFPDTLSEVEDRAFEGTLYIEDVIFSSKDITKISVADGTERGAFTDCLSLKSIVIAGAMEGDPYYVSGSVLYHTYESEIILCRLPVNSSGNNGRVEISSDVDRIADYAFYKCSKLNTIFFESAGDLTAIGDCAFRESGLTAFALGNAMRKTVQLGETVFLDCVKLLSFSSLSIAVIPAYTFSGCTKLNSLELSSGLTTIGDAAFYNCTSLMSISIPSSISSIYVDEGGICTVFEGCINLQTISVPNGCTTYRVSDGALYHTPAAPEKTMLIKYPVARAQPSCVVSAADGIAPKAFYGCDTLLSVTIDCSSWDSNCIGTDAFRGCVSLIEVINKSEGGLFVTAGSEDNGCIGLYARTDFVHNDTVSVSKLYEVTLTGVGKCYFIQYMSDYDLLLRYAGNSTSISFPESYVHGKTYTQYIVYSGAFVNNSTITEVTLSSGIFYLDEGAFTGCFSLTTLKVGTYEGKTLDNRSFTDCGNLVRIDADNNKYLSNEETDYILFNSDRTTLVMYPYARPNTSYNVSSNAVGAYAFYNCKNLKTVNFFSSVEALENHAFENCTGIEGVMLPQQITFVGTDVFVGCSNITSIMMPLAIDARIFSSCTNLATLRFIGKGSDCFEYTEETTKSTPWYLSNASSIEVTIGDSESAESLTTLTGHLFYGCTSIKSVTLARTISHVGSNVFGGNTKLTSIVMPITLDASNMSGCTNLKSITFIPGAGDGAGAGFDYDATKCLTTAWHASQGNNPSIIFNEGITSIGEYMFGSYGGAKNVTLAKSIETISRYAFVSASFEKINAPTGSMLTVIEEYAFIGSSLSGYVNLPVGLRTIGDYAYKDCTSLTAVNIPWTVIDNDDFGTGIFNGCTSLSMLYLPVTLDATDLTDYYDSITSIQLTVGSDSGGNKTGVSRSYSDTEYQNTIWHKAPNLVSDGLSLGDGITSIGNNMFRGTVTIQIVTVGDSLTTIGTYAFADCINMTTFGGLLSNATTIGECAFRNCSNVTELSVSDSIQSIGNNAFSGCTGIKKLSTPINIDASPFNSCIYLEEVVFTKGNGATEGIGFDYDIDTHALLPWYVSRETFTTVSVEAGVTYLGDYLLYDCQKVQSVVFATSVENIGDYTFGYCKALSGSLILPDNLKNIGVCAFIGCNNLSVIEIPESIQFIDTDAFSGCNSINELEFPIYINALTFSGCFDGGTEISKKLRLTRGTGTNAGVGYDYTEYDCNYLPWTYLSESITITINHGVTSIGTYTFYRCAAVQNINIPASAVSIGDYAFGDCMKLDTISFTPAESGQAEQPLRIGDYSFIRTAFMYVTVPDRVQSIGDHAFEDCLNLVGVDISNTSSLTYIGEYAFAYDHITTINIPANMMEIEAHSFYYTSLKTVTFVNLSNVLRIKDGAFESTDLTSFVIPDTISSMGRDVFNNCNSLTTITAPIDINLVCLHGLNNISNIIFTYGKNGKGLNYSEDALQSYKDLPWNSPTHMGLISITVGKGITKIGDNTFNGAANLFTINYYVENSVADIRELGKNAFRGCSSLNAIDLPEGLVTVGDDAFYGCRSAGYVFVPSTVQSLGETPFRMCLGLYSISVDGLNAMYRSDSGALFNADATKLLKFPSKATMDYAVPDSVMQISSYAFEGCGISGISFSDNTEGETASDSLVIGEHAFENCVNITSLVFPSKVNLIGEYAFYGCISVTVIKFFGTETSMDVMSFALGLPDHHVVCDVYSVNDISLVYYSDSNTTFNYKAGKYRMTFIWNTGSEVIECDRGAQITLPKNPETYSDTVFRYVFSLWDGYTEGMVAESDMTFNALYDTVYIGYVSPTQKYATVVLTPENSRTVTITASTIQKIKDDVWSDKIETLIINLNEGSIALDSKSLYQITVTTVTVSIAKTDHADLPEEIAKTVGDKEVFDIKFGDIHEFFGKVSITVKYEIREGQYDDRFVMWHMADNGSYTEIKANYVDKTLQFDTDSLSYFAVAQSQSGPEPDPPKPSEPQSTPIYVYIIAAALIIALVIGIFIFIKHRR